MYTIHDYHFPADLQEAYRMLLANRTNSVLGGGAWLKLGRKRIGAAIDLSRLQLDFIRDCGDTIEIGAMTTLREIEKSEVLKVVYGSLFQDCVKDIVGIQLRNSATIGGSVFSRFGFSDPLTALSGLSCTVVLVGQGPVPLEEFCSQPFKKDIIEKLILKKDFLSGSYRSFRVSKGDFPLLNVCITNLAGQSRIIVGARPQKAVLCPNASHLLESGVPAEQIAETAAGEISFGSNFRASANYRRQLVKALCTEMIIEQRMGK